MASKIFYKNTLTGGVESSLDGIDGNELLDGYRAFVINEDTFYVYILSATSGAMESSPDVIMPDANAGNKRWILIITINEAGVINTAGNVSVVDSGDYFTGTNVEAVLQELGLTTKTNTTHVGSDGTDHSHVELNDTHRTSDGKDHDDVVFNNAHRAITDGSNPHETLPNVTNDLQLKASQLTQNITDSTTNIPSTNAVMLYGESLIELENIFPAAYTTIQDWNNTIQSAGVISGGMITDDGDGTITVSVCEGIIKSTDSIIGDNYFFNIEESTTLVLTNDSINYIAVNYNSGTPIFQTTITNVANGHTIFNLGKVYKEDTIIDILNSGLRIEDLAKRSHQVQLEDEGLHFVSGAIVGETGTLNISISAGIMHAGNNRIITEGIDTNPAGAADTFKYYYYDGDLATPGWVETSASAIDSANYNDVATGLTAIGVARYGVHWVYKGGHVHTYVLYGQGSYKLLEAQAAQPPSSLPTHVEEMGVLRAKIIVAKDAVVFTEIASVTDISFTSSTPGDHAELSNLQGGAASEYYHLTAAQHTLLTTPNAFIVNMKTYGAVGTGVGGQAQDIIGKNAALAALAAAGGRGILYIPGGDYYIDGIEIINPADANLNRISIIGDGVHITKIHGEDSAVISIKGLGDSLTSLGVNSYQRISGMSLYSTTAFASIGLLLVDAAFVHTDELYVAECSYGIYGVDTVTCRFSNCHLTYNFYGAKFERGVVESAPDGDYFTGPNAHIFDNVVTALNKEWGMWFTEGTPVNFYGGSFEGNGIDLYSQGPGGANFGLQVSGGGIEGRSGVNIIGTYFENNYGSQVILSNTTYDLSHSISNCVFNRLTNDVTNHILIGTSAPSTATKILLSSNGFYNAVSEGYTVSSSRMSIAWSGPGIEVYDLGNTFSHTEDTPTNFTSFGSGSSPFSAPEINIAIIGDSLSQAYAFRDTWADQLKKMTNQMGLNINVKNWAVAGSTFYLAYTDATTHESGTRTQVQQCIAHGADIVFVALGINDSIYANTRTQAQIIQDGTDVYNALKAGLPSAQIVLINEYPHDVATLGLYPGALTNTAAITYSHSTITYKGQTGVRVNNATWLGTSVGATNLAKHQMWGNVATALNAIYDDNFHVDLWKIARLGCNVDWGHIDSFGHMWWAFTVLAWLATNNGVDDNVLNVELLSTSSLFFDLDAYYASVVAGTTTTSFAGAVANYSSYDIVQRSQMWMYKQETLTAYVGPEYGYSGDYLTTAMFTGCDVGAKIYFAWDAANLVDSGKVVSDNGVYAHTFCPYQLGVSTTVADHTVAYGILLADSTMDVFEQTINFAAVSTGATVSALSAGGTPYLTATANTLSSPNGTTFNLGSSGSTSPLNVWGALQVNTTVNAGGTITGGNLSAGTGQVVGGSLDINGAADIAGAVTGVTSITMNGALSGVTSISEGGAGKLTGDLNVTGSMGADSNMVCGGQFMGTGTGSAAKIRLRSGSYLEINWSAPNFYMYVDGTLRATWAGN